VRHYLVEDATVVEGMYCSSSCHLDSALSSRADVGAHTAFRNYPCFANLIILPSRFTSLRFRKYAMSNAKIQVGPHYLNLSGSMDCNNQKSRFTSFVIKLLVRLLMLSRHTRSPQFTAFYPIPRT